MGQYDQVIQGMADGLSSWFLRFDTNNIGTFTPIIVGSTVAGTFTYTVQNGNFVQFGNLCYINGHIVISAIAVAPTGNLQVGGLPITSAAAEPGNLQINDYTGITLGAGYSQLGARVNANGTKATLTKSGSNIQALFVPGGALALIGGSAELVYSGIYRIA